MGSRWIARAILLACVAGPGSFAGCNDAPQTKPSGGALIPSPSSLDDEEPLDGRAPVIQAISFKPAHILPGRTVYAEVAGIDSRGAPLNLEYRWTLNARQTEATGNRFDVPKSAKRGDALTVEILANKGPNGSETFRHSARVANQRPIMKEILIQTRTDEKGNRGDWHARPIASDPDGDRLTFRYAWSVNGSEPASHSDTLDRAGTSRGDEIRLTAWASDGAAESLPLTSAPFKVGNSPPEIVSQPPAVDDSGLFFYAVHATDPDGDTELRYALEEGPAGMTINPLSGILQWQATLKDAGEHPVRIAVDDGKGGSSHQGFYVQVEMILPPPGPGRRG